MIWKSGPSCRPWLILLAVLLPLFILSAVLIANSLDLPNSDFFTFWLAGRLTLTGQNPYLSQSWVAGHHQAGATWIPNPIFPYPLPLAILAAPLGLVSLKLAYEAWVVISEVLIVLALCLYLKTWHHPKKIHYVFPLLAAAFLFRPTLVTLRDGQLGAFMLFLISLALFLWKEQRRWPAVLALSFLFIKPTIGLPVIFLFALWLLFKKDLKTIAILITVEVAWLAVGFLMDAHWLSKFLMNGSYKFTSVLILFPNVWGISSRLCREGAFCTYAVGLMLSLILILTCASVLWAKKNLSPQNAFSLIIPVSLLITPYIWPYDQILLLIPLFFIVAELAQRGVRYLLTALLALSFSMLSLGLLLLALQLNQDMWSFLMPLLCLGAALLLTYAPPEQPQPNTLARR